MQYLLSRARWDTDGVRDDLRDDVTERLGDAGAVLLVARTGDLKKGDCALGAQRQYTDTDVGSRTPRSRSTSSTPASGATAMIDRELYLPRVWTEDPERLERAGVPDGIELATKPALAAGMHPRSARASRSWSADVAPFQIAQE